ncbi:hypothetical protein ADL15_15980 [Actinoplanes awajinensis subsp. mycoplanecinus]|uniref:Uncharacterized protein n=1 Tax=Actinoplanes awajinensis subsp. mycoplanecinus TaxID=135947 RepID=A0A0X3UPR4_9ACTN|nr:hypothetical protein ADL15_15980 [Actinoplanes awajinensis subsp. mycoplanecinus]
MTSSSSDGELPEIRTTFLSTTTVSTGASRPMCQRARPVAASRAVSWPFGSLCDWQSPLARISRSPATAIRGSVLSSA